MRALLATGFDTTGVKGLETACFVESSISAQTPKRESLFKLTQESSLQAPNVLSLV